MKKFEFGPLTIDPAEYGSQGNAVLGIRGSGKSYTATELGELLFDAGVPWVAFDPTGIWRFIRVPGKGKGYPVVVAGGAEGDLPLTVAGTPTLVRAAMESGISLVIDLHGAMLSKADWRRVVTSAVRTLLQENAEHGLRHIFIEEAAEFVPQRPIDWDVYAEVERLARVGGNSRLGYTLINQRSQEVNKAVLELCENIFLHRQRGKNALDNLDKWLEIAGAAEQATIIKSMPDLPNGQCWAWIGGDRPQPPVLIKVPPKNSFHPDRRVMRGEAIKTRRKPVDVGSFVAGMKGELAKIVEEAKANDPKALKARIIELEKALAAKPAASEPITINAKAEQIAAAFERGKRGAERARHRQAKDVRRIVDHAAGKVDGIIAALEEFKAGLVTIGDMMSLVPEVPADIAPAAPGISQARAPYTPSPTTPERGPGARPNGASSSAGSTPRTNGAVPPEGITRPQLTLLSALAWWAAKGIDEPKRPQLAAIAKWSPSGSNLKDRLSELMKAGLVDYPRQGYVRLTDAGRQIAPEPDANATMIDGVREVLTGPQKMLFNAILDLGGRSDRPALAGAVGWEPGGSNLKDRLSELRRLDVVTYPESGVVEISDWLRE